MARTKTKYRKYADGGAVPLTVEVNSPAAHIAADAATEHLMPAIEQASVTVQDDPGVAFQKQIDDLRKAEQLQRQREATPAIPQGREERLTYWRNHGINDAEASYLNALIENPEITHRAVTLARQDGLADEGSQIFHDRVRGHFRLLSGEELPKLAVEPAAAMHEFSDIPAPAAPKHLDDGGLASVNDRLRSYSGPVSSKLTESMGPPGDRDRFEGPGRVRLSVQQIEHARAAGVSLADYALGVLRLREEKQNGRYGGDGN